MKKNGRIRTLIGAGCATGALAAGVVAAPAGAAALGTALGPAVTDGEGTVALVPAPGAIRLLDADGGRRADVALDHAAIGCLAPPTSVNAVGGGQVLFTCPSGSPAREEPRLLDVETHEVRQVPGARKLMDEAEAADDYGLGTAFFLDVGSVGVQVREIGWRFHYDRVLDWRSGAIKRLSAPGEARDLDSPELLRPLCAPLQRDIHQEQVGVDYGEFWTDGEYGLSAPSPYDERVRLVLRRCGSEQRRVLDRGTVWWSEAARQSQLRPQLRGGIVSWTFRSGGETQPQRQAPRAHLIACGRTYSWPASREARASHVRDALVVSRYDDGARAWRVERLPLGGLCERSAAAERLTLAAGGRRTAAAARSGTIVDGRSGGSTAVERAAGAPRALRVRAGARIRLTTGAPAASVRWGVAGGRLRKASGRGRSWTLAAPAKRGARPLRIVVRGRDGGVTFAARVASTRR